MRLSIVLFFCLLPVYVCAQDDVALENAENHEAGFMPAFIDSLYKTNDLVVAYRMKRGEGQQENSNYFVLTRRQGKLYTHRYTEKLSQLSLPPESLSLLWKTFIQNDLFTMKDEKDIPNFCAEKYEIYGSYTYEFLIASAGKMKKLSYYDPEYYDVACYGIAERSKVINCVAAINYVSNRR